jgi:hypothetical protein
VSSALVAVGAATGVQSALLEPVRNRLPTDVELRGHSFFRCVRTDELEDLCRNSGG